MKITFLGTGTSQGVPVIACPCPVCTSDDPRDRRLRCSVLLEFSGGPNIVIDTGPDFRQQMLRQEVKRLDAVVFTHEHKDHIAGLDDVRAFNYIQQKHMDVYLNDAVREALHREFAYIFAEEKYPGIPLINLHRIGTNPFQIEGVPFTPIRVWHYKMPVLGFRVNDFAYITDANRIDPKEMDKLRGLDVLVLNALRHEKHISHFTLNEALEMIAELKPKRAYLTHLSHQMGLHTEVNDLLPPGVQVAFDGLQIECD